MDLADIENRNTFWIVGNVHRRDGQIVVREPHGTLLNHQCDSWGKYEYIN
jgi:hypothetical protein